jgi:hypothetical protein
MVAPRRHDSTTPDGAEVHGGSEVRVVLAECALDFVELALFVVGQNGGYSREAFIRILACGVTDPAHATGRATAVHPPFRMNRIRRHLPSSPIGAAVRRTFGLFLWSGPGELPSPLDRLDAAGEKALGVGRFGFALAG